MAKGSSTPESKRCANKSEIFIKRGNPYKQAGRFYIELKSSWSGICAIEIQDGVPVTFVSQCTAQKDSDLDRLQRISHANVLSLKEVFVEAGRVFFLYDQWGITLKELQGLSHEFQFGEVEVATVCKGILQGLKFIHNELGICHGDLTCSSVLVDDGGTVKIAGIGESMIREPILQGKSQDIEALCNIARSLLGLEPGRVRGTMGRLAKNFTNAPPNATVDDLLQHEFPQKYAVPQCVRPINILCTIYGERKDDPRG